MDERQVSYRIILSTAIFAPTENRLHLTEKVVGARKESNPRLKCKQEDLTAHSRHFSLQKDQLRNLPQAAKLYIGMDEFPGRLSW